MEAHYVGHDQFGSVSCSAFAEKELLAVNGYAMLAIGLASIAISCRLSYIRFDPHDGSLVRAWIALSPIIIAVLLAIGVLKGLVVLQPNESLVCLLFGSYVVTQHRPGFWWVNPFNSKNIGLAPPGDAGKWTAQGQ